MAMNSLLALLAAPAAQAAVDIARTATAAAAQPFEMLLQAAVDRAERSGSTNEASDVVPANDDDEDGESIRARLAGNLQNLLSSLGVAAGELVTLRFDATTGGVDVNDEHPLAAVLETELAKEPQIAADLARLAELEGDDPKWQFVAADQNDAAELDWAW